MIGNRVSILSALALAAGLCLPAGALADGSAAFNQRITELRLATAAFHSLDLAAAAGWDTDITGCLSSPAGGMGHHYVNASIFFDAQVDPLRPELLVYAPTPDGGKRLVAVEYLVFAAALGSAPVPELFGQTFHYNPNVSAWVLHVWLWEGNRNGLFADWNPAISCS